MSLAITYAVSSQYSYYQLSQAQKTQNTIMSQLSSGERITSTAIDPANAGILAELGFLDVSTRQSMRNTNIGMSMVQTAEGGASTISDNLARMRELAVGAASDTTSDEARAAMNAEYQQLAEEIDRVSNSTEFDGQQLISSEAIDIDVQVGTTSGAESRVTIGAADLSLDGLGLSGSSLDDAAAAQAALDDIDAAQETVSSTRSDYGATQNRLGSALDYSQSSLQSTAAASSSIGDADYATLVSEQSTTELLRQAALAAMLQTSRLSVSSAASLLSG